MIEIGEAAHQPDEDQASPTFSAADEIDARLPALGSGLAPAAAATLFYPGAPGTPAYTEQAPAVEGESWTKEGRRRSDAPLWPKAEAYALCRLTALVLPRWSCSRS